MHTWVVVAARRGRGIPRGFEDRLLACAEGELPFVADAATTWWSDDRSVGFAGWSAGSRYLGIGSYWSVNPLGLTAFSGRIWIDSTPWGKGASWASQLGGMLLETSVDDLVERITGVGTLVSLRTDGSGAITADPLGFGLLYKAETEDFVVVSNRASVAARAITAPGRRPARDVDGSGFVAHASNPQLDLTTFEGVRVVPQASVVHFAPGTEPEVRTWSDMPWWEHDLASDPEAAIEATIADVRDHVRLFSTIPAWTRYAELTGGRDSRAVFAALMSEGIEHDFSYYTWGTESLVDVQVANQIADRYGLDLRAEGAPSARRPKPAATAAAGAAPSASGSGPRQRIEALPSDMTHPTLDYEGRIRHHVWASSGALSVWDLRRGPEPPSRNVSVGGLTGELLRTSYPQSRGIRTPEDLDEYVRHGGLSQNPQGLLTADAAAHYQSLTRKQVFDVLPRGGEGTDAIDGLFVRTGYRRWFGLRMELDPRNRLAPLYSLTGIRTAFAIGTERRHAQELMFRLVLAGSDELARFRLAQRGWPVDAVRDMADPDAYPTDPMPRLWQPPRSRSKSLPSWVPARFVRAAARPKLPAKRLEGNVRDEDRAAGTAAKMDVFRRYLDLPKGHAVWDIVDRTRTIAALDRHDEVSKLERRQLYDAVTVAMWLEGADQRAPSLDQPIPEPTN